MTLPSRPRSVHTLIGESTLQVSLACLPTLALYSADPIRLVIHEDGSLTERGRDALRAALPGAGFIGRERADDEVGDRLKGHPRCRAARHGNILFMKIFDVYLFESYELLYCDSDVLFLRPFTGLFGGSGLRYRALFMTDTKEAYAVRPWHLWPVGGLRLASRVNSGLMRIAPGVLDLDFVEWLLGKMGGRPVWARRWYWDEQTCWAALAGRTECGLWDPRQVAMATPRMDNCSPDAVAIHFVSTYRGHLSDYSDRGFPPTVPTVKVECHPARSITPLDQLVSDVRARLR